MDISDYVLVALIGFAGVFVGALTTAVGNYFTARFRHQQQRELDNARQTVLKTMLEDPKFSWRKLETLKHVIGADDATTIRLLLRLGARASEDGQDLWGLISRNPFPSRQ
jgi:hypothetical protein